MPCLLPCRISPNLWAYNAQRGGVVLRGRPLTFVMPRIRNVSEGCSRKCFHGHATYHWQVRFLDVSTPSLQDLRMLESMEKCPPIYARSVAPTR